MSVHKELPTLDDLMELAAPHQLAVTVYLPSAPTVIGRAETRTAVHSAITAAIGRFRETGQLTPALESGLRAQQDELEADPEVWGALSSSLAVFLTPEFHTEWVLPNKLVSQWQASSWFDLGQLVRAFAGEQHAYVLTLSVNRWALWEATPTRRAEKLTVAGAEAIADAAAATNRDSLRDAREDRQWSGDEGRTQLLETYASRVTELVDATLLKADPSADVPLFLLAAEPLLSRVRPADERRPVVRVPGTPDEAGADQVDRTVRDRLPDLNARRISDQLARIADDTAQGLVVTELADIARAAVQGAVDVLVYEFTVDVLGTFDEATGEITLDENGYDLVSRIVVEVVRRGGRIIPVRDAEVTSPVWNGTAVAHLRFAV
ncbi:hypothetical protein [Raineyella sp. LH-20]|uniref:baeRF11 domain-containing protein n=1 Tax=Raineyella sp. LH-20 TaxID=3081204 RepID=UPI002952AE21|nr:hypothetical protein [Raineyella sp. LH-20]WOP19873.1 hypothetical protein R0146_06260 [Raineyella sp. LH-20]